LTIGVYASLSTGNLRATLVEHHRRFPDVDVHTVDGAHDRLLSALIGNAVDVAIMTVCRPSWDDRVLPLWSERVIVALPEHHSLGGPVDGLRHSGGSCPAGTGLRQPLL
jgi:DNA-binding transcriptional LysR family regulator